MENECQSRQPAGFDSAREFRRRATAVSIFFHDKETGLGLLDRRYVIKLAGFCSPGNAPFVNGFLFTEFARREALHVFDEYLCPLPSLLYNFFKRACPARLYRRQLSVDDLRRPTRRHR